MIAVATLVVGLLIAIAIFLFMNKKKKAGEQAPASAEPNGIIYGSMNCMYTVKQIEKYPDYTFVNCAEGGCPAFVTAFPTTKHKDGSMVVGFS